MPPLPPILVCKCSVAGVLPPGEVGAVCEGLRGANVPFLEVEDLCGLAARKAPVLEQFAAGQGGLQVVACHPRAVRWLFASAGVSPAAEYHNLRETRGAEVAERLLGRQTGATAEVPASPQGKAEQGADWKPWFPVIDFDLCTHCMQCLSFCLFNVYGVDAQHRIRVANPENCKTNCPACSRVCPEAAIMFPKFHAAPINGEPVTANNAQRQALKVDISALLGGDIYARLRERSKGQRFSAERDADTALEERRRCLAAMAEMQVPPEALMNLPSAEEIKRRAAEAQRQAEAALSARKA